MRILHVFSGTSPTHLPWAEGLITGLCGELVRLGHVVTVVSTNAAGRNKERRPPGLGLIEQVPINYFALEEWTTRWPFQGLERLSISRHLQRYVKRIVSGYDLVHIHAIFPLPCLLAARYCQAQKVPYIISTYGNLDRYMQERRSRLAKEVYLRTFGLRALNGAAVVHAMSGGEREMIHEFGVRAPIEVVDLGLNCEKYRHGRADAFRARHPETEGKRIIAYLGRISYSKGLDLLGEAFKLLCQDRPDCHLVLIGPDWEGYRPVVEASLGSTLADHVTFTGYVSEAAKVDALQAAELFVLPSYSEAFGIAILEAMAAGLPVILTDRAALATELGAAGAAIVTESAAPELAQAMALLLAHPERARRLADAGQALVRARFAWESVTKRFIQMYLRVSEPAPQAASHI